MRKHLFVPCLEPHDAANREPFSAIIGVTSVERFMTWAGAAVRPIARERLERFVAMVEDLEDVKDAGEMAPLLA